MAVPALAHVMSRLFSSIPHEILTIAFDDGGRGASPSLDARIKAEIIEGRVLPEINATCGKPKRIPLLQQYVEPTRNVEQTFTGAMLHGVFFRIPPHERESRPIIEARAIVFGFAYAEQSGLAPVVFANQGNSALNMARGVLHSHTLTNGNITPMPILRDGSLIQVIPNLMADGVLCECVLGYDAEFTNLPGGMVSPLSSYVIAVTKGYIYNKLVIQVDQGVLLGGSPLGRVRDIIDRYEQEGSLEAQLELLDYFRGGAVMDPENFKKYCLLAL